MTAYISNFTQKSFKIFKYYDVTYLYNHKTEFFIFLCQKLNSIPPATALVVLSLKLTCLFATLCQSLSSDFIRQKVESITGNVPQGEGQPASAQPPGSLLLQDDRDTVNGSKVPASSCLPLQTHLHQVNGYGKNHLTEGNVKGSVHLNRPKQFTELFP